MNNVTRQTRQHRAGIVHLGLGAFSRSHLSIYTEDATLRSGGDWGIVGVSLRSSKVRDELVRQQFAYTALQLNADDATTRQVEIISDLLVAPENPGKVLAHMADPAVKIVSLTVTEKGYCLAPSTGKLDCQHPDILHDLNNPLPVSAVGFLLRALEARMSSGHQPFSVLSCDNLPENGCVTRRLVLELANQVDPELAAWIETHGRFPSTMVDRITPATTPGDLERVQAITGLHDTAPVVHEPFSQWVIEDNFVRNERPDWGSAGAELVTDVRPYELMKLRMLNGTHSALAYLGYLAGFETIADTVADDAFNAYARLLWQQEIIPSLAAPPGVSLSAYSEDLMARYANPSIRHLTWQIAMDGSQKLPQRILGTLHDHVGRGNAAPGLVLAVAAWMRYVGGTDERGIKIDVRDPLADKFTALGKIAQDPEAWVTRVLALREVFPEPIARHLSNPVTEAYTELVELGAHSMVRRIVGSYPY